LFFLKRKHPQKIFWLPVFLSLFWLRQVFNGLLVAGKYVATKQISIKNDEVKLAIQLGFPLSSIAIITAALGTIICATVILKFIPHQLRYVFIVAGMVGSLSGYFIWMGWLGPVWMP